MLYSVLHKIWRGLIIIEKNEYHPKVSISLYEYGDNLVKNTSKKAQDYNIKFLKEDGTKVDFVGRYYSGESRMVIGTLKDEGFGMTRFMTEGTPIVEIFKSNSSLKIYIEDKERPTTNYLFTIDTTGFEELFDETFNFDI